MSTILTKMFCRIQNGRTLQKKHICMQNKLHAERCSHFPVTDIVLLLMPSPSPSPIAESCCLGVARIVFEQFKQIMLTLFYFVRTLDGALIKARWLTRRWAAMANTSVGQQAVSSKRLMVKVAASSRGAAGWRHCPALPVNGRCCFVGLLDCLPLTDGICDDVLDVVEGMVRQWLNWRKKKKGL